MVCPFLEDEQIMMSPLHLLDILMSVLHVHITRSWQRFGSILNRTI